VPTLFQRAVAELGADTTGLYSKARHRNEDFVLLPKLIFILTKGFRVSFALVA
jgi:hypothetical protein